METKTYFVSGFLGFLGEKPQFSSILSSDSHPARLAGFGMLVLIGAAETIGVLHSEVAKPGAGRRPKWPVNGCCAAPSHMVRLGGIGFDIIICEDWLPYRVAPQFVS